MNTLSLKNPDVAPIESIPHVGNYATMVVSVSAYLREHRDRHIVHMLRLGAPQNDVIVALADDQRSTIDLVRCSAAPGPLPSLTAHVHAAHIFERDLHERHGFIYTDHPWLKPVRFPVEAAHGRRIDDYPFFRIDGGEVHEVGVGPIHAGVIEPGHFRFQCTGEDVVHLEIMLGYQHRDVEGTMVRARTATQRAVISESIAGDTAIGHSWAHAMVMEQLGNVRVDRRVEIERTIALELERMAIHMGDLGALSLDVAWQVGASFFGALRTPLINAMQTFCGNRFGKGLIRPGINRFSLTQEKRATLRRVLATTRERYVPLAAKMFSLPSVVSRFERTGIVTHDQVHRIGAVGMSARMSGLRRDVRCSHPHGAYAGSPQPWITESGGDVLARATVRRREIDHAFDLIESLLHELDTLPEAAPRTVNIPAVVAAPSSVAVSLTEAWRGEVAHIAVTGADGALAAYRVKDPSMHNWFALALSLRGNEISDFPICNKSFDLSYCGHDL